MLLTAWGAVAVLAAVCWVACSLAARAVMYAIPSALPTVWASHSLADAAWIAGVLLACAVAVCTHVWLTRAVRPVRRLAGVPLGEVRS